MSATIERPTARRSTKDYMINHHLIITAAIFTDAVAAFVLAQTTVLPITEPTSDLFDDMKLTALCVMGAMMGAFLSIGLFPPKDDESDKSKLQKLALQFGCSLFTGVAFTPIVIKYYQLQLTSDWVVGVSTGVAAIGVMAIHIGMPYLTKWLDNLFSRSGS